MNEKKFGGGGGRGRRRGGMRFRPSGGAGHRSKEKEREARDARAEILVSDTTEEEKVFNERRHEKEIIRAENVAAGLPPEGDAKQAELEQSKDDAVEGGFRKPHLDVPAEVQEEAVPAEAEPDGETPKRTDFKPVEFAGKPPQGIMESIKAAATKVIQRVQRLIKPKVSTHKEVIINAESLETRVAVTIEGKLEEFTIERTTEDRLVGSIFKGKVRNLEDGLKAAFVDIGFEKNAFLHYWDIVPSEFDRTFEVVDRGQKRRERPKITQKDIPRLYPPGSEIIVQVTKGPIGSKGPRVTTNVVLPGRYLVLLPNSDQSGISRKIEHPEERKRLKQILRELSIPEGMGVIMRTVGEGQQLRYFVRDLALLIEEWEAIQKRIKEQPMASCVFEEPDLVERTVRDFLTEDVERIVIDNAQACDRVKNMIGKISKRSVAKVKLYHEHQPIFDRFGITKQLENTVSRQVHLKGGGHIVIDETEALVAIDVNTGRHKGQKDLDSTIVKVNLEAAEEICRQLRLRNMGGLIVLDFIDMRSRKDQQAVYQRMKEHLKKDKAKTHILPISQLGLMEMTRQRHSESMRAAVYDDCSACRGRGKVKSALSMSVEIQRKLGEILRKRGRDETDFQLRIAVHPTVLDRLKSEDEKFLIELEKKYYGKLSFRAEPAFHPEQFKIFNGLTNQELVSVGG
jgi:ribonuclease G